MRTITREELEQILINHQHWLNGDCNGWKNMRADLYEADLCGADLHGANLSGANLSGANLHKACLYEADLHEANLSRANLSRANLYKAGLYEADLCRANLCVANLHRADLYEANLYEANLRGAQNISFLPLSCPDTGAFTAWKRAGAYIVKLFVPADAQRLSATGKKCRCDKATVIAIENENGTPADVTEVCSDYDTSFKYSVHANLVVENFCEDRWKECSAGIHFFINREEAVNYK